MRRILLFARREYKAAVKTKGFIIGLVLAPIVMGGGMIAFLLLKDRVDTADKKMAIIDRTGLIAPALIAAAETRNAKEIYHPETGKKIKPSYLLDVVTPNDNDPKAQRLELSDRIRIGSLYSFIEIGPGVIHPGKDREASRILYYAKNAAMDDLRGWLGGPINVRLRELRLADAGIKESDVKDLFYWVGVEGLGLVSLDKVTGEIGGARSANPIEALVIPIVIMLLMLMMIMMSVPGMLHSVMEEKTQRIAEVLLGSIKPFEFMMGKVIGGIAVALTSSLVYIVGAAIAVQYMGYTEYVPIHILPWFFAYMLLAVIMFGAWSAALGATCSEAKDAQSLTFPSIIPAMFPMFIYFPVAKEPMGSFATTMSLIPPFTPLLMVLRMGTPGSVPAWQPWAGLAGVLVFTVLMAWIGGRIFRAAILLQGTPPKLSNIVKWAIRG
jgi:ABC-type Na+ efflux pump permease subunit